MMTSNRNDLNRARYVADYFINSVNESAGDFMSPLKLQKLCFLAQGWYLANFGEPLFENEIQAWAHGPVVVDLYQTFRKYGWNPIPREDTKSNPYKLLTEDELDVLSQIWKIYGEVSARGLEALTHTQAPWKDAYGDRPWGTKCEEVISHEAMRKYFQSVMTKNGVDIPEEAQKTLAS